MTPTVTKMGAPPLHKLSLKGEDMPRGPDVTNSMKTKNRTLVCAATAVAVVSLGASFYAHAVDSFDPANNLLALDAVSMGGTTYSQVRATFSA